MTGALDGRWKLTVRCLLVGVWAAYVWRQYQDPDTGEWVPAEMPTSAKASAFGISQSSAQAKGEAELRRRAAVPGVDA